VVDAVQNELFTDLALLKDFNSTLLDTHSCICATLCLHNYTHL